MKRIVQAVLFTILSISSISAFAGNPKCCDKCTNKNCTTECKAKCAKDGCKKSCSGCTGCDSSCCAKSAEKKA